MTTSEPAEVKRFREYLRIKTVHPTPDYKACAEYLTAQAKDIGLEYQVLEPVENKPFVIIKLEGSDQSLKSILLSSHTDVVPEFWSYPPFGAERIPVENNDFKIYARGSQDMKVTGSMYLEAMRRIKSSKKKLLRNVYAVFGPDEEIGGAEGVGSLIKTQEFLDLNAGFDFDEDIPNQDDQGRFIYAERTLSQVKFTANGNTGHGSQFIESTAIEKLLPVITEMMKFREQQKIAHNKIPDNERFIRSGEITSINLTQLSGGKQANVVPATFSAIFDIRVTPLVDLDEFRAWLFEIGKINDVEVELLNPEEGRTITPIDRNNTLINSFLDGMEELGYKQTPMICPGGTDARHIRKKGIPAFGFNPMRNHPMIAHSHNEYVLESEFLRGITVYESLVSRVANTETDL
ncbi:hypothetical protein BB561_003316 [Smittium simulii]|uniref:N-acyl-aliphatic-L-amino acid amidohydrolase n=1 Tax=Smittium simulii TaxID=133385 RepID=A0A2T9YM12_9FUNG|nr:hypothetical protein BB561_003316 [Smittium simulii]